MTQIEFKLLKFSFSHFQSSDPGLFQGEEGEEEDLPDPSLMSPAAKILKLEAESTVANITSYLLHYLGRELEDINIHLLSIYNNY